MRVCYISSMNALVPPDTRTELATLLRSRIPLVLIETRDESRALALLSGLAVKLAGSIHTPVFQWTVTDGLRRLDIDLGGAQKHNSDPAEVLKSIRATDKAGIYVLLDFHPFLADPDPRPAAEGHLSGLRSNLANPGTDQPRTVTAARTRAFRGALPTGISGPWPSARTSSKKSRANGRESTPAAVFAPIARRWSC